MADDDALHIGEKIKALRIQKGWTQRELAGDYMTRSMLSLAESGSSVPSVQTLVYLSSRLGVHPGYFFVSDEDEKKRFVIINRIDELRKLYSCGKWNECIEACSKIPERDDEMSYILSVAHVKLAFKAAYEGHMKDACAHLAESEKTAGNSLYCTSFEGAFRYIRELFGSMCCETVSPALSSSENVCEILDAEIPQFFLVMKLLDSGITPPFGIKNGSYTERYIEVRQLLESDGFLEGVRKTRELFTDYSVPVFVRFRICCDLEKAANRTSEMRLAYTAARRKTEMTEKYKMDNTGDNYAEN